MNNIVAWLLLPWPTRAANSKSDSTDPPQPNQTRYLRLSDRYLGRIWKNLNAQLPPTRAYTCWWSPGSATGSVRVCCWNALPQIASHRSAITAPGCTETHRKHAKLVSPAQALRIIHSTTLAKKLPNFHGHPMSFDPIQKVQMHLAMLIRAQYVQNILSFFNPSRIHLTAFVAIWAQMLLFGLHIALFGTIPPHLCFTRAPVLDTCSSSYVAPTRPHLGPRRAPLQHCSCTFDCQSVRIGPHAPPFPRPHRYFSCRRANDLPKIPAGAMSPTGASWRRYVFK